MQKHLFSIAIRNITIALFLLIVFTPFFTGIFEKDKDISTTEKRKLALFPSAINNISDIINLPKAFEKYYSDHFGFRESLTKYYKLFKLKLGDSPSNDVTIGKDGWLFLGSVKVGPQTYSSDPMGDAMNSNLFSSEDLKNFSKHIESMRSWLKDKGIEYVFVIAPNKHTVYFDKLPDYVSKINEHSATDQLVEYLQKNTNVTVVDLRKPLIDNKDAHQLYFKTDTHWNYYAANIAQYTIITEIEKFFPGRIFPEIYKIQEGESKGGGDLALILGMDGFQESSPKPIFEDCCIPIKYPEAAIDTQTQTYTCDEQELTALIYRDSFFGALQPFFARKFKQSTYIWGQVHYTSLRKHLENEHPDIVIEEWVERTLPFVPNIIPEFNRSFYKNIFEDSQKTIYKSNFNDLTLNNQIKCLDRSKDILLIQSVDEDPIINFPFITFERDQQYLLHIDMQSSVDSIMQIYYSDTDQHGFPFSEDKSIRAEVCEGDNDIYILLDYNKLGKSLRLDPISCTGELRINTFEIKQIDEAHYSQTNKT